ncbi:MAG: hypothetical protein ACTHNY_00305, partial [Solirubrobacterales bacterium]
MGGGFGSQAGDDSMVSAAAASGVTIHAEVSTSNPLPTGEARTNFINWVHFAVERYGYEGTFWKEPSHAALPYRPITTWEVWNEPNLGNIGATEYGVFLNAVANSIQNASESKAGRRTNVLSGGLLVEGTVGKERPVAYYGALSYLEEAYAQFGSNGNVTGVAVHPYEIYPETFPGKTRIQAFETAVAGLHSKLVELAKGGAQKALWITEAGWPADDPKGLEVSVGPTGQATLLRQAVDYVRNNETSLNAKDFLWYNFRDAPGESKWDNFCGLRDHEGNFRPAWTAFQEKAGVPQVVPQPPGVVTQAASAVQDLQATLNGTVNPAGLPTTYWFEYGTTTSYGSSSSHQAAGSGESSQAVTALAGDLQPATTYHFRIVANNAVRTSYGADITFTTVSAARVASIIDPKSGLTNMWRGSDGNLYETVAVGGKWTTFSPTFGTKPAGVGVASAPALAIDNANGLVAVWRGSDGNIYETSVVNGAWSTFSPTWSNKPAGVTAVGVPSPVIDPANGLSISWRGSDGNVYETLAPGGGSWTTFSPTWSNKPAGVTVASDPAAVIDPTNGLSISWRGSDGNVYETSAPGGGSWTSFSPTWSNKPAGVTAVGVPSPVIDPANGLSISWRGSDGNVYE